MIICLRMTEFNRVSLLIIPLHVLFVWANFNIFYMILVHHSGKMIKMSRIMIISFRHAGRYSEQFILIRPSMLWYEYRLLIGCYWHVDVSRLYHHIVIITLLTLIHISLLIHRSSPLHFPPIILHLIISL